MVLFRRFENEVYSFDQIVNVLDELLLQNQMPFIDLFHTLAVLAEHVIVMGHESVHPFVHVGHDIVVELNLCRVHFDLVLHNGAEGVADHALKRPPEQAEESTQTPSR